MKVGVVVILPDCTNVQIVQNRHCLRCVMPIVVFQEYENSKVGKACIITAFTLNIWTPLMSYLPASVAQLDAPSDWRPGGHGFNPCRGWQHSFLEIDHEIFFTVILSLRLIQEGQLSVSGERMCTILVNHLED